MPSSVTASLVFRLIGEARLAQRYLTLHWALLPVLALAVVAWVTREVMDLISLLGVGGLCALLSANGCVLFANLFVAGENERRFRVLAPKSLRAVVLTKNLVSMVLFFVLCVGPCAVMLAVFGVGFGGFPRAVFYFVVVALLLAQAENLIWVRSAARAREVGRSPWTYAVLLGVIGGVAWPVFSLRVAPLAAIGVVGVLAATWLLVSVRVTGRRLDDSRAWLAGGP